MKSAYFALSFIFLFANITFSQIDNNCTVLSYNTSVVLTSAGVQTTEQVTLLVHNNAGDKHTTIQIPYSKISPINLKFAQIETIDGQVIRKLKSSEAILKSDISSSSLYTDRMIYEFNMRHNSYPYILKYEYSQKDKNYIELCRWTPAYKLELKSTKASLSISVPLNEKLNIHTEQLGDVVVENSSSNSQYTWQSSYTPNEWEPYSDNIYNLLPKAIVTANDMFYGIKGNMSTWQNFGLWYSNLTEGLDEITPNEKIIIDGIISESLSTNDLIKNLYKNLQTTKRYINVSTKIGGIKPYPAKYVCTNGYGDCKALSNYMKAILKYAGIQSNLVLVYADDKPIHFPLGMPNDPFNHVILCVPNNNDTIWLECTSKINPPGYLGRFTQNRAVLLIDANNSRVVKTPKLSSDQCFVNKNCSISKTGITKYNIEFNGPSFENIKSIDQDISKYLHEYILDNYLTTSLDVNEWQFTNALHNIPQINLFIKGNWGYNSEDLSQQTNQIISIPELAIPKLPKNNSRKSSICFPFPICISDTTIIETSTAFKKVENNIIVDIKGIYASYQKRIQLNEGNLYIIRHLNIPDGTYSATNYHEISSFFQSIIKSDKEKIIIRQ